MFRTTFLLVTLALVPPVGSAEAQSLAEVAKKEKERRAKQEKTSKPVRKIDEAALSGYRAPGDPGASSGVDFGPVAPSPAAGDWPAHRTSPENPNRRPPKATAPSTSNPPAPRTPPRDPTLGPEYIEDHLYGEENLKRLRREASECRVKERPSSQRCKDLEKKAADLQKLLRERRRIH